MWNKQLNEKCKMMLTTIVIYKEHENVHSPGLSYFIIFSIKP